MGCIGSRLRGKLVAGEAGCGGCSLRGRQVKGEACCEEPGYGGTRL